MPYFTKSDMLFLNEQDSDFSIIKENFVMKKFASKSSNRFDIFLSHSTKDKKYILGLYNLLSKQLDLKVYVDWIVDPGLDKTKVTVSIVETIKKRMQQSELLIFVSSDNSVYSFWATWETGFFDGFKGKVCVLPILDDDDTMFKGNEYFLLYPKLTYGRLFENLRVRDNKNFYKFASKPKSLTEWINE